MDARKLNALTECHRQLAKLLGPGAEPVEVLARAEEHRDYWRPKRTSVVLLAESHVYTTCSELARKATHLDSAENGVPRGFVRLVYCLGYGENALLDQDINTPKNSGTPQYWKLFYSCVHRVKANEDFAPVLKAQTRLAERIQNKLALLRELREAGVWLVDTSLAALFRPGGKKPSPELREKCLQTSWDRYVRQVVLNAKPSQIVCIGKGVAKALGDRLSSLRIPVTVVPQPNARRPSMSPAQVFRKCYEIVWQARKSGDESPHSKA
jgi:hypothetical protein